MTFKRSSAGKPRTAPLGRLAMVFGMAGSLLTACHASPSSAQAAPARPAGTDSRTKDKRMWMTFGERRFAVTLADTDAANAFRARLPLTLDMADLNGNEKHAELKSALPAKPMRPGTIRKGDVMLYGDKTLVVFYESFHSTYAYTRIGVVDDPSALPAALVAGDARIAFSED